MSREWVEPGCPKTVVGKVTGTSYIGMSRNGHATFAVAITSPGPFGEVHRFGTGPDAQIGMAIENQEFAESDHEFSIDSQGMIVSAAPVGGGA